jgi:hypothetical protein
MSLALSPDGIEIQREKEEGEAHTIQPLTHDLDVALLELWGQSCNGTQLSGADGGEVVGVREEDSPAVTDPVVELDGSPYIKNREQ